MKCAQASLLADGRRLHLHHGPIDLIVEASGAGRTDAYVRATKRFESILNELVAELPMLRMRAQKGAVFSGAVARRMQQAVEPYCDKFVTPMIAVAGAVADEILEQIQQSPDLEKAYVNNGGDVAFYLVDGQHVSAAIAALPGGRITLDSSSSYRGIATSGWSGRSYSLGIADSVSVVAKDAASADVAATMIANAVNLPNHPHVTRVPAVVLSPDSDLGDLDVTTYVGDLSDDEIRSALHNGSGIAQACVNQNLIGGAILQLKQEYRQIGVPVIQQVCSKPIPEQELSYA